MSLTVDTLPPEIVRSEGDRKTFAVLDPSPGLWGGEPVEGLVTIAYICNGSCGNSSGCEKDCTWHGKPEVGHTHHALYGPEDEETVPVKQYSLYAD